MYFADLQACDLWGGQTSTEIRAVGWLDVAHEYTRGDVPEEVMLALLRLLVDPWQPVVSAGRHPCVFCRFTGGPGEVCFASTAVAVGSNNLFVPAGDCVLAAPSLIAHYIDAHGYAPPEQFQQAVLACPPMGSIAYLKAIRDRAKSLFALRARRPAG